MDACLAAISACDCLIVSRTSSVIEVCIRKKQRTQFTRDQLPSLFFVPFLLLDFSDHLYSKIISSRVFCDPLLAQGTHILDLFEPFRDACLAKVVITCVQFDFLLYRDVFEANRAVVDLWWVNCGWSLCDIQRLCVGLLDRRFLCWRVIVFLG